METMNVVLCVDHDHQTGVATHFLVGLADRATRNWLASPSVMPAVFVAQRILSGVRFETCYLGELGPDLAVQTLADGNLTVVTAPMSGASFGLEDMPPCGARTQSIVYRGGRRSI